MRLVERHEAMASCSRTCDAAKAAAEWYHAACLRDSAVLRNSTFELRDIRDLSSDLEPTYLVRLFAVFETTLRDYWEKAIQRKTYPPARDLIDSLANQNCDEDLHRQVHEVREYRNFLVHGGEERPPIPLGEAKARLCRFLALCLRREW